MGLFELSDPSESLGNTVTAREILDAGAERIETELADQPVVQAPAHAYHGRGCIRGSDCSRKRQHYSNRPSSSVRESWVKTILNWRPHFTNWDRCTSPRAGLRKPSPSSIEPSPSGRRGWAPDHPTVAISLSRLADLYNDLARNVEAEPPSPTRPDHPGGGAWPGGSGSGEDPDDHGPGSLVYGASTKKPGSILNAGWTFGRRRSVPIIPMWGPASTAWRSSIIHSGATPRPSLSISAPWPFGRRPWGLNIPGLAGQLNNLAALYERLERYEEAEASLSPLPCHSGGGAGSGSHGHCDGPEQPGRALSSTRTTR